jgi:DNA replication protein DnaC
MQRHLKAAQFRELKTLEDFDWQFNPSIKKKQVYDLASGRFIREARDSLWLGPPGTGKSHLCQAIGYQAIKLGFLVLYRSIFDVVRDFPWKTRHSPARTRCCPSTSSRTF